MKPGHNENRRSFFKQAGLALVSTFFASRFGTLTQALAAAVPPALKENEPLAKSLLYVTNAAKADPKKKEAKGAPADQQKCSTCMLYTKIDDKLGKCSIFPNNTVLAGAWCNSWTKKA